MKLNSVQIGNQGFPLIILHGWGKSLKNLQPLGELLSHYAQVHLLDLPGFGNSDKPQKIWGIDEYADSITSYMNDKNIKKADFMGHSFGGKTSMHLSIKHPSKIRHLILISSSGIKPYRTITKKLKIKYINLLRKSIKLTDKILKKNIYKHWFISKFGSNDYKKAGSMRPILVKTLNQTVIPEKIMAETLILWGEDDFETSVQMGKQLCKKIENSKLIIYPNKGHYPFDDTGSHLCASHIIPFISKRGK